MTVDHHELTVTRFHASLLAKELTAEELTRWYLDRVKKHSEAGAELQAVVTVNDDALAEARALDARFAETGTLSGPLHGVPVLVKDQAETAGIRTTFGSKLFEDYVPDTDATVVAKLKQAGAVILAKASMCDFAAGWFSASSMTDHTKNPYDLTRDSGGSSAGSAVGVSANLALLGVAEDTGGSIRIPASFTNLFGLRVTTGLISRTGFSPLVHFQDTPGPVGRHVEDLAVLLEAIVGYDPADPFTAVNDPKREAGEYVAAVENAPDLSQWTVGVIDSAFGSDDVDDARLVNTVVREAIGALRGAGTTVQEGLAIDDLPRWIAVTSLYAKQSKSDIDGFLSTRPSTPVNSFREVYDSGVFHPLNDLFHDIAGAPVDAEEDPDYHRFRVNQEKFRRMILDLMARSRTDFLIYPTVQVVPPTRADLEAGRWTALTFPTNTVIASQTGLPAVTVPAGFTPAGLPVGLEVLGRPFSERDLLSFARAWERAARPRRAASID
ncbi:amidase [Saccharopolyspora sp. K220]|uniref:amidase n=1 Tax=Saccharopolyspora soli TaxID=2926618 RepID=UPI001F569E06|nr:amidase [Saccharopolyspora soli]MCI2422319.1 amidase [Saccharopolyspora soli]